MPADLLLLGGEPGITARRLAVETGDPMRPSTRVADGALVALVRRYQAEGDVVLTDASLRGSDLYREAVACLNVRGRHLEAYSEVGLLPSLRRFVRAADEIRVDEPAVVRRVRHSSCYQVQQYSPGLIGALARGIDAVDVVVLPGTVTTPLQDLLVRMSWLAGTRQLYQPIAAPELDEQWKLVRQCTDRLDLMLAFLDGSRVSRASYLDVASCYGWFVARMRDAGYDAHGVERDPLAIRCGEWVYGLRPDQVVVSDAGPYLRSVGRRFDIVSCLSLLHHVVVTGEAQAAQLVRGLDAITGSVLFLDTGEGHEAWLRHLVPDWDATFVAEWLRQNTWFAAVVPLSTDRDRRPSNGENYGRTLFACVR